MFIDASSVTGIVGNGITDCSGAVQQLLTTHGTDTTLYFPPGVYRLAGLSRADTRGLTICGAGPATVLQYVEPGPNTYTPILSLARPVDFTLRDMTIDNRHILHYGGIGMHDAHGVTVQRVRFCDSDPRPTVQSDCYGLVLARGIEPSKGILVEDCTFEHLQLELDHVENVVVRRNVSYASRATGAIGFFTVNDRTVFRNIVVQQNTIIDPRKGRAIMFAIDPVNNSYCTFEDIQVLDNTMVWSQLVPAIGDGHGIFFGKAYLFSTTQGNVFRDVVIRGNRSVSLNAALPPLRFLETLSNNDWWFEEFLVEDNATDGLMDLRNLRNGQVRHNIVWYAGLSSSSGCDVEGNIGLAKAPLPAYALDYGRGGNWMRRNRYIGTDTAFSRADPIGYDKVELPVGFPPVS